VARRALHNGTTTASGIGDQERIENQPQRAVLPSAPTAIQVDGGRD